MSLAVRRPVTRVARVHCDLDNWDFDPRYTAGACPICGWAPPGVAAVPTPTWLKWADTTPWDLVGLGVLFVFLLIMGIIVANASGFKVVLPGG